MADNREHDAPDTPGQRFAQLIRERRATLGWTQAQLAERSGLSIEAIKRLEAGQVRSPDPEHVRRICQAVGIDPRRGAVALGYLNESDFAPDDQLGSEARRALRGASAAIHAARIDMGWSNQQLAERSGVDFKYVAAIDSGTVRHLDPAYVRPIFDALKIPRLQLAAVGQDDAAPVPAGTDIFNELIELLESPSVPDDLKLAALDYLRYVRKSEPGRGLSATERFFSAIGKPHPAPLTPEELAEFEREMDEADAAVARRWSSGQAGGSTSSSSRLTA